VPLGHLAFDDMRVRSAWAHRVEPQEDASGGPTPGGAGGVSILRGNTACSPLLTPGRPKNEAFSSLSATSRQVPSIATRRRPTNHEPGESGVARGRATRTNSSRTGSAPSRARAWKIADFDALTTTRTTSTTTTSRRSAGRARPRRSLPSTTPSRWRTTPSPLPATSGSAARFAPPQRSLRPPGPVGTPWSTSQRTPSPTDGGPRPASPIQHEATTRTASL
jgi:hypothetical protein